jgi:ribonuclease HII
MLKTCLQKGRLEAGCDEAGRGCLAGPVFAAAVVLPEHFTSGRLDDSKKLNASTRMALRTEIEEQALAFAVGRVSEQEIDEINILNASFLAMHRALDQLKLPPEFILVDGNRFTPYHELDHACIVKGDGIFASIAAASILAKTYRDEHMMQLHEQDDRYAWNRNMGYPTRQHREAIARFGLTRYHRRSFRLLDEQLSLHFLPAEDS